MIQHFIHAYHLECNRMTESRLTLLKLYKVYKMRHNVIETFYIPFQHAETTACTIMIQQWLQPT